MTDTTRGIAPPVATGTGSGHAWPGTPDAAASGTGAASGPDEPDGAAATGRATSTSEACRSQRVTWARTSCPCRTPTRVRSSHARIVSVDPSSTATYTRTWSSLVRSRTRSARPSTAVRPVTRSPSPASVSAAPRTLTPPATTAMTATTTVRPTL